MATRYEPGKMTAEKSWDDFYNSGMLWWVNHLLHTFGWSIILDYDEDKQFIRAYPARVKFRGFDGKTESNGFIKVSKFMAEHAEELLEEAID